MRILIVVCQYFGDTLIATSLARSLVAAGHKVDWLVSPGMSSVIEGQPFVNKVYELDLNLSSAIKTFLKLGRTYDRACVLTPSTYAFLVARSTAKHVYMLDYSRSKDMWKRTLVRDVCKYDPKRHRVSYTFDMARMCGVEPEYTVGITWSESDRRHVQSLLGWDENKQYVHLHPLARFKYKFWSQTNWKELATRLLDSGLHLVVTGSPHEKQVLESMFEAFPQEKILILAGKLSWPQLASLSQNAVGYIGPDTSITHLAASTGTKTLALFGPTDPCIWGPWPNGHKGNAPYQSHVPGGVQHQENVMIVQQELDCVPCQLEGCDRHKESHSVCLDRMSVERVWQCWKDLV